MTRLLVSVRNVAEAEIAAEAGVDLIDLKEPRLGSLGAVTPETMADVLRCVNTRAPVSVALGELLELQVDQLERLPAGLAFAKVGLAGCVQRSDWPARWQEFVRALPQATRPVAVAYADDDRAASPSADEVIAATASLGAAALLVDTWKKDRGGLLDHWSSNHLIRVVAAARDAGLFVVLGGSLDPKSIPEALKTSPDFIAVRGAICDGSRVGDVNFDKICGLIELIRRHSFRFRHAQTDDFFIRARMPSNLIDKC